jgi:hypothetical protein
LIGGSLETSQTGRGAINGKRVFLSGLLAGLFVHISEAMLNAGILMEEAPAG